MSVNGLDKFREAMSGFEDSYALIGGSACDILFAQQGEAFRATKDLDVVVLADRESTDFARAFWAFIRQGSYDAWQSRDGELHFYRFMNPGTVGYPHMVELFARHPEFDLDDYSSEIAPLPFDEDISSLSAILLNDDYYALVLDGLQVVDGVSTLDEAHLALLKMRAHIDLNDRAAAGQHVNGADLKKHRKDVLRLLEFVPSGMRMALPESVKTDARRFVTTVEDQSFRMDQLGLTMNREAAVQALRELCGI